MFANIHLRATVVENLKDVIDSHCIAGRKMTQMLEGNVPCLDEDDVGHDDIPEAKDGSVSTSHTPSVSSPLSTASLHLQPGTPSYTCYKPIVLPDAALAKSTPPSRAQRFTIDDGFSPLTANLTTIDEMFGGADIMSDEEEENDIIGRHDEGGHLDTNHVYRSGHGRYKCNRVQCLIDDPWSQVPHNCGFHHAYCLPDDFQYCGDNCRGAFCKCLKFYQSCD